jgi:hypothetical protein
MTARKADFDGLSGPAFPVEYREARFVQICSHIAMPRSLLRGCLLRLKLTQMDADWENKELQGELSANAFF